MHSHSHHHHEHGGDASSRRIGLAFFLNAGFTVIEFIGGWLTNSTAIMADAVHDVNMNDASSGMKERRPPRRPR
ncbi:cation transporter [Pseudomonas aeruginosa]|uniref:cation transporter n=1 Tax=Pseudomonas aeruginosa TaxID=287 RepID=UPI003FD4BFAA